MTPITGIRIIDIAIGLAITPTWNTTRMMTTKTGPTGSRWCNRILDARRRT
jgi:hypothetical protein